jgi:ABC-type sugar transport system ATPase subunit
MRAGRIEQIASPHAIFARPASLFVAGFIGTPQMNLIAATIDRVGPHEVGFRSGSQQASLALAGAERHLRAGDQVTLGIRPRAFELVSEPDPTTLAARVDMVEPMGAETLLHLLADGRDLRAVVGQRERVAVGAMVHARLRPGQTHIFDHQGRRLALADDRAAVTP